LFTERIYWGSGSFETPEFDEGRFLLLTNFRRLQVYDTQRLTHKKVINLTARRSLVF